jgi:hypothetical protein
MKKTELNVIFLAESQNDGDGDCKNAMKVT